MKQSAFEFKLRKNPRPVVVEFWAPWCGPCKMMAPSLKKAEQEFSGKVDLWRINADENSDLLRSIGIRGIPTMIGYNKGAEISRKTGAMTAENVLGFFSAVAENKPFSRTLSWVERILRIVPAIIILVLGWLNGPNYWIIALGAVILFSAFSDRITIWKTVSTQFRAMFKKKPA